MLSRFHQGISGNKDQVNGAAAGIVVHHNQLFHVRVGAPVIDAVEEENFFLALSLPAKFLGPIGAVLPGIGGSRQVDGIYKNQDQEQEGDDEEELPVAFAQGKLALSRSYRRIPIHA